MNKEWIEIAKLQKVSNLVTEKEYIDEAKKMWEEIFKEYQIDYKFDIVVDTEYEIHNVRTKGQLKKVYLLKAYTTKECFSQAKRIINEYMEQEIEQVEEQEVEKEDNYETKQEKTATYFFVAILLIAIIFEIGLIVSTKNEGNGIIEYVIIGILIIIELYGIVRLLKK